LGNILSTLTQQLSTTIHSNRYELEARRRNVEVEKKQHELDLLNRKFEELMTKRAGVAGMDEDSGPLEATIVHMKKEITAKQQACSDLQVYIYMYICMCVCMCVYMYRLRAVGGDDRSHKEGDRG